MSMERPQFFYKYRSLPYIQDTDTLETRLLADYAIQDLFASKATFSTRKNFNDLFDSKIELVEPTAQDIKVLKRRSGISAATIGWLEEFVKDGRLTAIGRERIRDSKRIINELLDRYALLSLASTATSNLMWAHYANCHNGFCIEFKAEHIPAERVNYEKSIPKIELANFLIATDAKADEHHAGFKVWEALKVKLDEWAYEGEYRIQLSENFFGRKLTRGELFVKVPYQAEWIESIIFGVRMSQEVKVFIAENLPFPVQLKQAVPGREGIRIEDSPLIAAGSRAPASRA